MSENDEEMENEDAGEDEGLDQEKMEAAQELGRLASQNTEMSGRELAQFIWDTYQLLVSEDE